MDERLTHSQRLCYMSCPKMHEHRYVHLIRPTEDGKALRMGAAFHLGMEHLNGGAPLADAIDGALFRVYGHLHGEHDYEMHTVQAMVRGYHWRWQDAPWHFEAFEQALTGPICNPETGRPMRLFSNAGKVDGIVRSDANRLACLEYKTTSEDLAADSFLWQQYGLSTQALGYMDMARRAGFDVQDVIYDVTRKPLLRPRQIPVLDCEDKKIVVDTEGQRIYLASGQPRQAPDSNRGWVLHTVPETPDAFGERILADMCERPDWYFARREIPVLHHDQRSASYDIWATAKNIAEARSFNRWPRNTNHCGAYGRCPYLPLCLSDHRPEDPLPEGFEVTTTAHPEID